MDPTWEHEIIDGAAPSNKPCRKAGAGICSDFKLNGSPCLLLNDHRTAAGFRSDHKVADPELHQLAATQLAINSEVKQRAVSEPLFAVEEETDCPNLLLGKWPL